jgi:hypothetical protein
MRRCPVCSASLAGRRRQTRYCSGKCRAEASREERILSGAGADGYQTLPEYRARRRTAQVARCCVTHSSPRP